MATAKKLPSGAWRVQLYTGKTPDGKRQYKSFTAASKKEAEFLAAQYNQLNIDVCRSEMLLSEAVKRYIKSKENILSPSTVRGYYVVLNNYLPELMSERIKDITAERVQIAFNDFAKSHSPKTCRNAHGLISAVLKANRPELQLATTLPQKQKCEIYVPDEQEVREIKELARGTDIEVPFLLAVQCGLRASEISGLTLTEVHTEYITIKQARVDGVDGAALKAPKSVSGYRKIPISREFHDFLVENADGDRICNLTACEISARWGKFRTRHDLDSRLNFHALRHHFASKCLLLGMPQKYTAELMGHSSLDMIEKVYQHTFPSAMELYAEKLRESSSKFMQHEIQHENINSA